MGLLRKNTKVELISRVPLFERCSKNELGQIAMLADELDLPAGKAMTREGDRGREFFVLIEGEADVRKGTRKLNTMRAGDFFGEISLLTNSPRTATVTSSTPVRVLVITDRAFRDLLKRTPQIQSKVLAALAQRVAPTSL